MLPADPNGTSPGPQPIRVIGDPSPVQYQVAVQDHGLSVNGPAIGSRMNAESSGASFLHALRRRWFIGVSLGLVCASFAVAFGFGLWSSGTWPRL